MSTAEHETIEEAPVTNRKQPFPRGFLDTISTGWADRPESLPSGAPAGRVRRRSARQAVGGVPRQAPRDRGGFAEAAQQ